ncbi:Polygalacturonase ADPG1 [Hordeum vulgare]|nr:Polygalacturonase ADPG1 [Hordeum vulgare]
MGVVAHALVMHEHNAKALRLAIELSECEASKEAAAKTKTARHAKEQDRLLCMLSGKRCISDCDVTDGSISRFDNDAPLHANAYMEEGHSRADDRKEKGLMRQ